MIMPNWTDKNIDSFVVDVCFQNNGQIKMTALSKYRVS